MNNPIDEVKKRIDIVDFISSFLPLKKSGRNFKALCPFHQEKTPSFIISPERQIWRCFGACQEGGDAIKFLMKWENITFYEALRDLAKKTGVKLKTVDFEDKAWKKREKLFSINRLTVQYYNYVLKKHKIGKKGLKYLKERDINKKIIDTFNLGYAPSSWDSLLKFLSKKGHKEDELYEAGLLVKSDRGTYYDRFRKRLIFPIKDARGNVLGFSGRLLKDENQAKYINTPETPVYKKRQTLYGIDLAKDAIKKEKGAVLVEGEFDMISLFQRGIKNTIAVKGSAVTSDQLKLIKRYTDKIILSLDTDFSGKETTKRAIVEAEKLDFNITVASFDFGKDPDEAIREDSVKFKKIIKNPVPIYDFIIDLAVAEHKEEGVFSKKKIGDEVIPFLVNINNPIVKSHYIKKMADILEVDEKSVEALMHKEVRKRRSKKRFVPHVGKEKSIGRYELLQKYILSLVFQSNKPATLLERVCQIVEESDFAQTSHQKLFKDFLKFTKGKKGNGKVNIKSFIANLPKELVPAFDEVFLFDIKIFNDEVEDKSFPKALYELKKLSLKERIKKGLSEGKTKDERIKKLNTRLSEVEKKLSIL